MDANNRRAHLCISFQELFEIPQINTIGNPMQWIGWIHEPKSLARRGDTFRYPGNPEIRRFGSDFAGNPNVQNSYPKRANRNLNVQFLVRSPQVRILNVQLPGSKSSSTILKVLHSEPKPNIGTDT